MAVYFKDIFIGGSPALVTLLFFLGVIPASILPEIPGLSVVLPSIEGLNWSLIGLGLVAVTSFLIIFFAEKFPPFGGEGIGQLTFILMGFLGAFFATQNLIISGIIGISYLPIYHILKG